MQKKTTAVRKGGKGEKVGQEPTSRMATCGLCTPEVESSRKPAKHRLRPHGGARVREGGPPEPEGRTMEAWREPRPRSMAGTVAAAPNPCCHSTEPGLQPLCFFLKESTLRCVLIITKFTMNYLRLCLSLFGIFASKALTS